jgi:hypothetical protein
MHDFFAAGLPEDDEEDDDEDELLLLELLLELVAPLLLDEDEPPLLLDVDEPPLGDESSSPHATIAPTANPKKPNHTPTRPIMNRLCPRFHSRISP